MRSSLCVCVDLTGVVLDHDVSMRGVTAVDFVRLGVRLSRRWLAAADRRCVVVQVLREWFARGGSCRSEGNSIEC